MASTLSDYLDYLRAKAELNNPANQILVKDADSDVSAKYANIGGTLFRQAYETEKEIDATAVERATNAGNAAVAALGPSATAKDKIDAFRNARDSELARVSDRADKYKDLGLRLATAGTEAFENANKQHSRQPF